MAHELFFRTFFLILRNIKVTADVYKDGNAIIKRLNRKQNYIVAPSIGGSPKMHKVIQMYFKGKIDTHYSERESNFLLYQMVS